MKRSLPVFLIFVLSVLHSVAQFSAPPIQFGAVFGGTSDDVAKCVRQTFDGYIVAGYTNSANGDIANNHGSYDFWIVKLDNSGDTLWEKTYGGINDDRAFSIKPTTDSGFIVAGAASYSFSGEVTGNHGNHDFWIIKLDGNGNIIWETSLGGTNEDDAYDVQQTFDGGYIAVGQTNSTNWNVTGNHGGIDVWVVKLSASGNLQYEKCLGGTGDDIGYSIQQTADSGFIIAGNTTSINGNVSGNHGGNDAWIVKLGSINATDTLVVQWTACLGGSLSDYAQSVQQTKPDGGYIVAGYSNSTDGDLAGDSLHGLYDCWIVKLDPTGSTIQWQKLMGGSDNDEAFSIQQTTDSGYVFLASSNSLDGNISGNHGGFDYWMVKLDQYGDSAWQKALGGSGNDSGYSIQQTTDGGFILAGSTTSNDGDLFNSGYHSGNDMWIVKLTREVGIAEKNNPIAAFQVYPNPVSQSATVLFSLTQPESVTVKIYDVTGREIKNLNQSNLSSGIHTLQWNADNTANVNVDNGLYLVAIETPDGRQTKSVAVIK